MLRIRKIEVLEATIPRSSAFEISRGTFVAAHRVFVRATLEDGVVGYGECGTLEGVGHGQLPVGTDRPVRQAWQGRPSRV